MIRIKGLDRLGSGHVAVLGIAMLVLLLSVQAALGASVTLNPVKDNTLYEPECEKSNGSGDFLFSGDTDGQGVRRCLLAFDIARSGASVGLPVLLGFCSALLKKSLKGGLIAVGGLNLGGGLDPVYNAVSVAELAVEKGATTLLIPISARRQLNELSDEMAMKLSILYYADAREALLKALTD